ncbi:MAG: hypothetical protein JJU29_03680 [Verrucomicrobia bacterium]|nr:hypothetical protein [Verrucomicrobiota bacterium]MCH8510930.1 hypothetical protein [Kiritimatiellia bacterium]
MKNKIPQSSILSFRAVALGLLLGLFIAGFAYFNDQVVQSTFLIGNFLPIGVFGVVLLLILLVNPLLVSIRESLALKGSELAIITAMGLAACAWPGSNLYRTSTGILALPNHLINFESSWQSNHLMSYVPGLSDELAQGHVRDWGVFARDITNAQQDEDSPFGRLKAMMTPVERGVFERAASAEAVSANAVRQMTATLNRLLREPDLPSALGLEETQGIQDETGGEFSDVQRIKRNRALLVAAFPGQVLPSPRGASVLVDVRENEDRALSPLLEGRPGEERLSVARLPWDVWGPTIGLWGTVVLSLGLATVCMALIVHRQWSGNELLSYPVVRFLEETLDRQPGKRLPVILQNKLFWLGFVLIILFHLQNGLAAWFPAVPSYPETVDLSPLTRLFPNARQVPGAGGVFNAPLFFSVIAFAFYLDSRISLSLGLSNLFWVIFGAFLIGNGITIGNSYMGAENGNLLRFGAYIGFACMILYTGRRHYREAFLGSIGLRPKGELPAYISWAGRGLALGSVISVIGMHAAGLTLFWAIMFTGAVLIIFLVLGRIVAETGAFFLQPQWLPIGVFTALFGFEAIGPTQYIVMAVASALLAGDPRTTLMPFILNGLKLGDTAAAKEKKSVGGRLGLLLLGMVFLSFFVAGAATLWFQYNEGVSGDQWANRSLPSMPFQNLDRNISELGARGTLSEVTANTARGRIPFPNPDKGAVGWMLGGMGLVLVFAIARLRLTWWPFHPVIFLVWGTFPMGRFGLSFLVGWMIKEAVIKTVGAKGFHTVKPLMVGVICAEVLAAICWGIVALLYYRSTGLPPITYRVFPG